ncbi:MAG: DUF3489 domain-containing protein [Litoreibacter sp.]
MTQPHVELASTNKPFKSKPVATSPLKPKVSKKVRLLSLISRPSGATMPQLEKHLVWQPHTIRAAISRLRSNENSIALDRSGKGTRYRLVIADMHGIMPGDIKAIITLIEPASWA